MKSQLRGLTPSFSSVSWRKTSKTRHRRPCRYPNSARTATPSLPGSRPKTTEPSLPNVRRKACGPQGAKALFIGDGHIHFDIGWVGTLHGETRVDDGRWHHVALTGGEPQRIYVDGELDATGDMEPSPDRQDHVLKLGYASTDFPEQPAKGVSRRVGRRAGVQSQTLGSRNTRAVRVTGGSRNRRNGSALAHGRRHARRLRITQRRSSVGQSLNTRMADLANRFGLTVRT